MTKAKLLGNLFSVGTYRILYCKNNIINGNNITIQYNIINCTVKIRNKINCKNFHFFVHDQKCVVFFFFNTLWSVQK